MNAPIVPTPRSDAYSLAVCHRRARNNETDALIAFFGRKTYAQAFREAKTSPLSLYELCVRIRNSVTA